MKNDKLIPGTILVLIGVVILLDNFGYIDFHWGNLWHMWPILLIIGGVNLVFAHNRSPLTSILKIGVVILGFALLLFGNFSDRFGFPAYYYSWHNHDHNNNDKDDDDDDDDDSSGSTSTNLVKVEGNSNFALPYDAAAKTAELNISGGGTEYDLNDTTSQLFKADTKEHFGQYEFSHHNEGSNYVLDFNLKDHKGHFHWGDDDDKSNKVTFRLNPAPEWDLNIETGATALNFDLTKFKIHSLKLSGGAASFDVKLGQPVTENTNVEVSTGMASVTLNVPQTAACKIVSDSGLSSTDFSGFTKTSNGDYETPGFDAAKSKIFINISGGLADFNVKRY